MDHFPRPTTPEHWDDDEDCSETDIPQLSPHVDKLPKFLLHTFPDLPDSLPGFGLQKTLQPAKDYYVFQGRYNSSTHWHNTFLIEVAAANAEGFDTQQKWKEKIFATLAKVLVYIEKNEKYWSDVSWRKSLVGELTDLVSEFDSTRQKWQVDSIRPYATAIRVGDLRNGNIRDLRKSIQGLKKYYDPQVSVQKENHYLYKFASSLEGYTINRTTIIINGKGLTSLNSHRPRRAHATNETLIIACKSFDVDIQELLDKSRHNLKTMTQSLILKGTLSALSYLHKTVTELRRQIDIEQELLPLLEQEIQCKKRKNNKARNGMVTQIENHLKQAGERKVAMEEGIFAMTTLWIRSVLQPLAKREQKCEFDRSSIVLVCLQLLKEYVGDSSNVPHTHCPFENSSCEVKNIRLLEPPTQFSTGYCALVREISKVLLCVRMSGLSRVVDALLETRDPQRLREMMLEPVAEDLKMSLWEYQLRHLGHEFPRPKGVKDQRCGRYTPDEWQRTVLDIIDAGECLLLSAPTSSGKTFISYYAIEKVLREPAERGKYPVAVFVAPTKALVNQVHAEILARFDKNYPKNANMHLCGVFTRDYRKNSENCQILVTVPACLEILLLSPQASHFTKRLRFCIFDEIHTLFEKEAGETLQTLLSTIDCQFMALSATLAEPQELQGWLQSIQHQVSKDRNLSEVRKIHLIIHNERFNDLYMHFLSLRDQSASLLNPLRLSDTWDIRDIRLVPEQCVEILHTLQRGCHNTDILNELDYDLYFSKVCSCPRLITMKEYSKFEEHFKLALLRLEGLLEKCYFNSFYDRIFRTPASSSIASSSVVRCYSEKEGAYLRYLRSLCQWLQWADNTKPTKLPAILFVFSRAQCQSLAHDLVHYLTTSERCFRMYQFATLVSNGSTLIFREYKGECNRTLKLFKTLQSFIQHVWKSRLSPFELFPVLARGQKKYESVLESYRNQSVQNQKVKKNPLVEEDLTAYERYVAKIATFHFHGRYDSVTLETLKEEFGARDAEIATQRKSWSKGVGYHHAGLGAKEKKQVEHLFRAGRIRILFSTATLAYGINMPCKSVLLLGNSNYLNPLMFRQMAGRAGRRGLDNRGDVYIEGLDAKRIQKLLCDPLPYFAPGKPLTASLLLRLIVQNSFASDEITADQSCCTLRRMILCPYESKLATVAANEIDEEKICAMEDTLCDEGSIQHTSGTADNRYLLQKLAVVALTKFLLNVGALEMCEKELVGSPSSGLLCHLSWMDPYNIVFLILARSRFFAKICDERGQSPHDLNVRLLRIIEIVFPLTSDHACLLHSNLSKSDLDEVISAYTEYTNAAAYSARYFSSLLAHFNIPEAGNNKTMEKYLPTDIHDKNRKRPVRPLASRFFHLRSFGALSDEFDMHDSTAWESIKNYTMVLKTVVMVFQMQSKFSQKEHEMEWTRVTSCFCELEKEFSDVFQSANNRFERN